jgi:hypothetical protein
VQEWDGLHSICATQVMRRLAESHLLWFWCVHTCRSGMSFTNFYATPLCAMGRAELLTGRDFPRTGNLFNS